MPEINSAPKMTVEDANKILTSLDPQKILDANKDKIEEAVMESAANERASREPLPGPAGDIFETEPLVVKTSQGDVTIRPMVAYDINCFSKINSPFYRILMGDTKTMKDTNNLFTTEEESYELVYQFTHPCKEIYKLLKQGLDVFKDKVMEEIAFKYNPVDAAKLVEAIMSHIFRVNMARVNFDVPEQSGEAEKKTEVIPQEITGSIV